MIDESYTPTPLLVAISDLVVAGQLVAKRRARRANLELPDDLSTPVKLMVEVIPYLALPDGSYGAEATNLGNVFSRKVLGPFVVSDNRYVDKATGQVLLSRINYNDTDWAAAVQKLRERTTLEAMPQAQWFAQKLREEQVNIDGFIQQYILMLDASGDLG